MSLPRRCRGLALLVLVVLALPAACGGEAPAQPRAERRQPAAPVNARVLASVSPRATGPLTGVLPAGSDAVLPLAVMVDNAVPARPQYGLAEAELVYELLVEHGMTRFMAVYGHRDAPRVQPVRSARTPFLLLALELDAVFVHVGAAAEEGPADAESQMRQWGVRRLTEEDGGPINRDPARPAPHNAMTSTAALRLAAGSQGWSSSLRLTTWQFKDNGSTAGAPASGAELDFDAGGGNGGAFAVRWQYDASTNTYLRWQGGAPHLDAATGAQHRAANVVIQLTPLSPVGDRAGHVLYQSEGRGRAVVLRDGRAVEGAWRKDGRNGRTRYYDEAGREIAFNRGATWVEMLPPEAPFRVAVTG